MNNLLYKNKIQNKQYVNNIYSYYSNNILLNIHQFSNGKNIYFAIIKNIPFSEYFAIYNCNGKNYFTLTESKHFYD